MFYLETKDGDKFFTNKDSVDKVEFEKILEDKLGADAANMFNCLVEEDSDNAVELLNSFARRYHECIQEFDKVLNTQPVDTVKLEEVLCELQQIYLDYMRGGQ